MLNNKYLIRLDDACPYMDRGKWGKMEALLDKYGVKPMVGIVPECKDNNLVCQFFNPYFWETVHLWQNKGWAIAMHGYDHCYISEKGMQGLNPMWKRSEFAGVALWKQQEKIRLGVSEFKKHGVDPKFFFAPSHTFDNNTLIALREESDIRIISDTIGRYPYKDGDFIFIPQILGHCSKIPIPGFYTFCFHPNSMDNNAFDHLEEFLRMYYDSFVDFDQIDFAMCGKKKMFDVLMSCVFFMIRKFRGLR